MNIEEPHQQHENENEQSNLTSINEDEMPINDKITLSPIDKYRIYGKFPWKMLIHIMLILATTMQAIVVINATTDYCRGQERVYYNIFISDSEKEDPDYPRVNYIYSITQLREHLSWSIENYFKLSENSLEKVTYDSEPLEFVKMEIDYINKTVDDPGHENASFPIPVHLEYNVTQDYLGPFNENYTEGDIKEYLDLINKFSLKYVFKTYVPFYYEEHLECFGWIVYQEYDFTQRAHFEVSLNIKRTACSDMTELKYHEIIIARFLWVHIIVILLSAMSLLLTWRNLYQVARIYWAKKHIDKGIVEYKKNKHTFNKWALITLIGNILQLLSGVVGLLDKENMNASTDVLVGFGCMFAYFNIGKYLDYNIEYSTIYATLQRALPNVIRFLIGVMPIFIGFTFFGLCVFWRSERFYDTSSTTMALFSMINGDSIYDIISDLSGISFFLGQIYSYSFCILFIVVVMNVFISIIEEAYVSSKMRNQNHWIYNYLKIDPSLAQIAGVDSEGGTLNVEGMTQEEIKDELDKRIRKLEEGLEKCEGLIQEVESIEESETKEKMRKYLRSQFEDVEKKIEKMRNIWNEKKI